MESSGGILYETLDAASFFSDADPEESYAVFRNQITAATDLSADVPVTDFFSLDFAGEEFSRREAEEHPSFPPIGRAKEGGKASELAWFRAGSRFKSPMIQLHKEIVDFCEFLSPTPEEQASRNAAVCSVSEVVKYIWPQAKMEVFGSFRTGLYLPTSDIDVVILESKVKTTQMGLYALSRALNQRNIANKIQVIAKARVPIIKFVEKQSGISFDISFDMDGGPKAADYIKDAVSKLPPLRPLCLILKVFLQQRELNEVYSGGIGSYTLLAMLIAHLQVQWRGQVLQRSQPSLEHNLGILLVNFFDFYGRKLNTTDVGLSCNSRFNFFLKADKGFFNSDRPDLLSIEDPQTEDNDIGRNSFNFYKVKSAFSMAYSLLTDARTIANLGSHRSILGTIIRPDPILLDRKGGNNGELTFDRLLPGADELILQHVGNGNGDIYNWQLLDEEPLPREKLAGEDCVTTPSKKRLLLRQRKRKLKRAESGETSQSKTNGVASRGVETRKRRKAFDADGDRLTRSLPRNWGRNH